jgi:hypothetical protein
MENDTNEAQEEIPGQYEMQMSQILGAGVNRLVSSPDGHNDERQCGRHGNQQEDIADGVAGLVPLVADDGQRSQAASNRQSNKME